MSEFNLKHYAHIGDAVFELFAREIVIKKAKTFKTLHTNTVKFVNASFQSKLLLEIEPCLNEAEAEIAKRARNLPLSAQKKNNQATHRLATAFEALLGYWYLEDKERLNYFFEILKTLMEGQNG